MQKSIPVLLLFLMLALAAVSCDTAELPPLEGERTDLAAEFISCLVDGDYEGGEGYFNARMKKALPAQKLQQVWEELQSQVGSYVGEVGMREEVIEGFDVVFVTTEFEDDLINIRVVFGEDRRITGLWFDPVQ